MKFQHLPWVREFMFPESCVLCHSRRGHREWYSDPEEMLGHGEVFDPHLCLKCWERLKAKEPGAAWLEWMPGHRVLVMAAQHTHPDLVALIGVWKYFGIRGLRAPLARLMVDALRKNGDSRCQKMLAETAGVLVPIPLHGRRRRNRGFNQAEELARLVGPPLGLRSDGTGLQRRRATAQQAKQDEVAGRVQNLKGAFRAQAAPEDPRGVILVDDLVTSGATVAAAVQALQEKGWTVKGVICLGLTTGGMGAADS